MPTKTRLISLTYSEETETMARKKTRRNFILSSIAVASGIAGAKAIEQQEGEIAAAPNNQAAATVKMPERLLGNTGVKVPIFGLGGPDKHRCRSREEKQKQRRKLNARSN
ncbi:hypothetical protein [Microcoleus vaginatus]|uniref:hypothetical protein n=1 Tax=Microcoleus vaginatus TaxID=119532 RepID=UPI00403F9317